MSAANFIQIFTDVCMPVFVSAGLGWLLDRRFRLHLETLVKLNIYLLVPAFIFTRLVDTEMSGPDSAKIIGYTLSTIAGMFLCSVIVGRVLRLGAGQRQSLSLATMFYNCGNFGLPIVTLAFGHEGAAAQVYVLVTMNVATFTVGLFLAQEHGESPGAHWRALMQVLRQPALYAVASGVICRAFALPVKNIPWIWQPLNLLQAGLIGMALLTLGVQMSQTRPAPLRVPLWSAINIRLVMGPLLGAALVRFFYVPPVVAASLILACSAPTAVNTALLAHEFGGDVTFATSAVYYSTLFSMATTTVTLALLRWWMTG